MHQKFRIVGADSAFQCFTLRRFLSNDGQLPLVSDMFGLTDTVTVSQTQDSFGKLVNYINGFH